MPGCNNRRTVLITAFILIALLASRVDRLTENVWTLKLTGDCYLDYHTPIRAVALACPGVDYMRLWPLPVEQQGNVGAGPGGPHGACPNLGTLGAGGGGGAFVAVLVLEG